MTALTIPLRPMSAALYVRGQLVRLGYRVFLLSHLRMMLASPERPTRFQEYHIHQTIRLLETWYA